jgi:heme iron utilization protein
MNGKPGDLRAALGAALVDLHAKPDGVLEAVAEKHGLTVRDVLGLLPEFQAVEAPGSAFEEIWGALTCWGEVLFLLHGRNGVFEIRTTLPPGTSGQGYFNIHGDAPLGGHLRADRCAEIWFVDRAFFGRRSCSLQFLDREGDVMFKVFVARDGTRELDTRQLGFFEALRERWTRRHEAAS